MALTLTLDLHDKVYVRDYALELIEARRHTAVLQGQDGEIWHIEENKATEVAPQVMVHIGLDNTFPETIGFTASAPYARLVFRAPRSIPILREGVYMKGRTHAGDDKHKAT